MALLNFLGAIQQVTGSCYLIETFDKKNILLECGMQQGGDSHENDNVNNDNGKSNGSAFAFNPEHIDAVVKAKKFDLIPEDLIPGDRVMIDFYPVSKSGVSKSTGKPWTITELIVMKFAVTEKLPRTNTKPDVDEVVPDDDLPF